MTDLAPIGLGVALGGAAGAVVVWAVLKWRSRRSTEGNRPAPLRAAAGPSGVSPQLDGDAPPPLGIAKASTPSSRIPSATIRLSQRVVIHLARLGDYEALRLAPERSTQAGISRTLGATQSAVSRVLRSLSEAGVVGSGLRHAPGGGRRIRAYWLTSEGLALAREIATHRQLSLLPGNEPWGPTGTPPTSTILSGPEGIDPR